MLVPPQPSPPLPPYVGLNLSSFVKQVLRAYPDAETAVKKLCTDENTRRAFHYYMVNEHFAGMRVEQRGVEWYITRASNTRGTASYETYTYVLWKDAPAADEGQNPKTAYKLFSEKWHDWVTVTH